MLQDKVCVQTIRNVLNRNDLRAYRPVTKPLLTQAHRANRILFAEDLLECGNDILNSISFSDESRFDSSNLKFKFVRRPLGERFNDKYINFNPNRSVAHVMVWGCFSKHGHSKLIRIDKTCKAQDYIDILKENLLPHIRNLLPNSGFFQQDNCPIHKAKITKEFFEQNNMQVLEWPPISPDLNPIENIWGRLSNEVAGQTFDNSDKLFEELSRLWDHIMNDTTYVTDLLDSIPNRLSLVLSNGGGPTPY